MNMKVAALVVTFNRAKYLKEVLNSLVNQTYKLNTIVIVDNNSSDDTHQVVKNFQIFNLNIVYHNTGENLGGAGGFHYGFKQIKSTDYDFLWLMDDDLQPSVSCLENLLNNSNADIRQPLRVNIDGSCAELSPIKFDLKSKLIIRPKRISVKDLFDSEALVTGNIKIEGIPFEGPLIKKHVIDNVGLPNPNFFIFYDDVDYAIRARNKGYKIECLPSAIATRLLVNIQANDLNSWKGYFMLRNLFFIQRQYGENWVVRNRSIMITIGYIVSLIFQGKFSRIKSVFSAYKDSFTLSNTSRYKP